MIDARTGQSLTTGSLEAAKQYQLAVDRILGSETGAAEALDRALALDSNLALALSARYMLAKDAKSTDADVFKERALMAAEAALPWDVRISSRSLRCLKTLIPTLQRPRPTSLAIRVTCWSSRNFVVT